MTMYFSQWLRASTKRRGPIGDLARDFVAPGAGGYHCCSRFRNYGSIKKHIFSVHHPCDRAIEALKQAHREYMDGLDPQRFDPPS